MSRGQFGRSSVLALGVLAALVVTGCASGAATDPRLDRAHVNAAPLDLSTGFAQETVPLTPRVRPLVVAAGNDVFVFGGFRFVGGQPAAREVPNRDGAIYSSTNGTWRPLPAAPFRRGLYHPAGVWTGDEVVVLGTPCGATSTDTDRAKCTPGGIEAAAYSPAKHRWRALEKITAPTGAGIDVGIPLLATGAGWTGGEAAFAVASSDPAQHLLLVDPATGASRTAPDPNGNAPGTDIRIAEVNGARVTWPLASETFQVLLPGAAVPSTVPKPAGAPSAVTLSAMTDLVLVDETATQRPPAPLTLGFLDPARYVAAHS